MCGLSCGLCCFNLLHAMCLRPVRSFVQLIERAISLNLYQYGTSGLFSCVDLYYTAPLSSSLSTMQKLSFNLCFTKLYNFITEVIRPINCADMMHYYNTFPPPYHNCLEKKSIYNLDLVMLPWVRRTILEDTDASWSSRKKMTFILSYN